MSTDNEIGSLVPQICDDDIEQLTTPYLEAEFPIEHSDISISKDKFGMQLLIA